MAALILSLKARALRSLARREYTRAELRRKLAPHEDTEEQLDALLDVLQALGLQDVQQLDALLDVL
ncbi:MAG: hypothetical protein ACRC4O_02225, partial [Giesbergeria sp.]